MKRRIAITTLAFLLPLSAAHADILGTIVSAIVDGGNNYNWRKVELPGTVCGNGSQYKFFFHKTNSPNLLILFEGGGACWDYDTCSGRAGVLGAANPNGIPDNYITQFKAKYVSPIVNGADPGVPLRSRRDLVTRGWNVAYLPYCTGDVHVGNNVVTYNDPTGKEPPLRFHHGGFTNTTKVVQYLKGQLPSVNKLLVTGFSAGGTATSAAYYIVRRGINPQKGYMINDSGPIYPAPKSITTTATTCAEQGTRSYQVKHKHTFLWWTWYTYETKTQTYCKRYVTKTTTSEGGKSARLHKHIETVWALDSLYNEMPASFDRNDFGSINGVVAQAFPGDQLSYTAFSRDYNYSRFSYERFYSNMDKEKILTYWKEDQDKLVAQIQKYPNFSYFIPWQRPINDSHCTSIITFIGSHACQRMEKKREWWEYLEWPWGQTYKCYSEFVAFDQFLNRFVGNDHRIRIYEPKNDYNKEDPGMKILAPIIGAALDG